MKNSFQSIGFLFIMIAGMFHTPATAQTSYMLVKGMVLDAATKLPMSGASVQAAQTTMGTATDAEGRFTLYLPEGGYRLQISYTGYSPEELRVSASEGRQQEHTVYLAAREKEMQAVAIVASNEVKNGWEKYGELFRTEFIGQTERALRCRIENPEVLKFYFSKKRNRLKVMSDQPLRLDNEALGYRIQYHLDSLIHEFASGNTFYAGYPMFEEKVPQDTVQASAWRKAREEAYLGSIIHFMRSLYQKNLEDEGFEVQFIVEGTQKDTALRLKNPYSALHHIKNDSTGLVTIRPNQPQLGIFYLDEITAAGYAKQNPDEPVDFQFSMLSMPTGSSLSIEPNGFYEDQDQIVLKHYWIWEKTGDLLPYNYTYTGL